MKAPKCRTCGKEHWERVCPNIANRPEAAAKAVMVPVQEFTTLPTAISQQDLEACAEYVKQTRAKTRARVQKHRAKQKDKE